MTASNEQQTKIGRNPVPLELVKERRKYAVGLKQAGLSTESILKSVNAKAQTMQWGIVSRRTVERDIAHYFRENKALTVKDFDHLEQLRESHISQMEGVIEKMALYINRKEKDPKTGKMVPVKWKAFEYPDAVEKLFKMQDRLAEIRNWNHGKMNVNINLQQNNFNQIHEQGRIDLINTDEQAKDKLSSSLEQLLGMLPDEADVPEVEVIDEEGNKIDIKDITYDDE